MVLADITSGVIQDYRIHRMKAGGLRQQKARAKAAEEQAKAGNPPGDELPVVPPARSTLHQEMVCLRQILKTAHRQGWLAMLPDLSAPYKSSGKVRHRA